MTNPFALSDQVAIVTGASSGIGAATALALAQQGAAVAINYHQNEAGAAAVRQEVLAKGGRAITVQADVTKAADVRALVDRTVAELGPIDILVNNAGSLVERMRLLELTEERFDEVIALNLKSAFLCSQAVAGSMIERQRGAIINVSSIAGRNGGAPGSLPYSAAKGGMITMTKTLAKELSPYGIRVNAVAPGVIETPFHEVFSTPEMMKSYAASIPLGRVGSPPEAGNVVAVLASGAASYLTGETIELNGGLLML